ncbi:MAG TPA: SUMF1/EgtB/PvdO family nonheme iron enzyme [Thermoanaerobaculia bacterium]|jgi:formylglycine-generating enzyme required for sulfatase activity|nr:SUMF1/EgtB/PvdO family nonheme iron enzyme [Thermoanaerobaculia bacterium]
MSDVFVSYKKEDFPIAEPVVNSLRAQGLSVWWDENLTSRSSWDAEIEQEISSAAAVVVLWTPRSVESEWVRIEAHYASERGKLIPVMLETCTIPLAFLLRQTVNLSAWHAEADHRHWRKLLAWIGDLTGARSAPSGRTPHGAATPRNAFRATVDRLASGDPVVEGSFVNTSTPAGTALRDGEGLPILRIVPAGAFLLGSPPTDQDRTMAEGPQRRIEIPVPFAIGVYPVLVSEYEAVMGQARTAEAPQAGARGWWASRSKAAPPASAATVRNPFEPVTNVSFHEAQAFVTSLSLRTGESYRVPSEAEWEYACRSGSRARYCFGDVIDLTMAIFGRNAGPVPPGSCTPNAFGLFDMHGNVREWTADLWHESYNTTPLDGRPAIEGHGSMRVVRGGGWSDSAAMLRSTARMRATESMRTSLIGFRVARALA